MGGFYFFLFMVSVMLTTMLAARMCAAFRGEWSDLSVAVEQRVTLPVAVAFNSARVVTAYRAAQVRSQVGIVADVAAAVAVAATFLAEPFAAALAAHNGDMD